MKKKEDLFHKANSQLGFFTTKQAEECGFSRQNFHRLLNSGEWTKEERGIYKLSYYPLLDRPELSLWSLWSQDKQGHPQGVWSHETALDIYEIADVMPVKMHMSVPTTFRSRKKRPPFLTLHYQNLRKNDIEERDGYRITTPIKTLIDVQEDQKVDEDQIAMAVKNAMDTGLITKKDILQNSKAKDLLKYLK